MAPRPPFQPAIITRRSLLQQSLWFYYLTFMVLIAAVWIDSRAPGGMISRLLYVVFLLMLGACFVIPVLSVLSRKRTFRQIFFPRKLRTTKEGKWFMVLTILIGFAAINSGDNLLYLILAMMLSFIIISGLLSEASLRKLEVRRVIPPHVFADGEFPVLLKLRNRKSAGASYSLILEDPEMEKASPLPTTCYTFCLPPGSQEVLAYNARIARRGRYELAYVEIATLFPFNFFMKSMERDSRADFVVYPRVLPLPDKLFPAAPARQRQRAGASMHTGLNEFHSLKEYRHGDNPRWIHWKVSARQNDLMVKTFDSQESAKVVIVLNNHVSSPDLRALYERTLSLAASTVAHFHQRDYSVYFIHGADGAAPQTMAGGMDVHRVYRTLAELQPAAEPTGWMALTQMKPEWLDAAAIVILSPEPSPRLEQAAGRFRRTAQGVFLCAQDPRLDPLWSR